MKVITVERKVLEKNDELARENRENLKSRGIFTVNLVSSPGAGKTCLIERTLERLAGSLRVQVVEGDIQTDLDAQRVARYGVPVVQIVTHGACHLEARLVQDALARLPLAEAQVLIIENVGNLVCPAGFDLGEDLKVVLLSVTEGDDKPLKYPAMFRNASVLLINKVDLLPYVPCNLGRMEEHARSVNPDLTIFEVSCTSGSGLDAWCDWLRGRVAPAR
ncbi:MAG: hydrogenase nickel incorporation protein HypB [bacterium]